MGKTKKLSFLEWNKKVFISSIKKINLNIFLIVILDALFYLVSGYLFIFWLQRVQYKIATFNLPTDIVSIGPEKAQQIVSQVKMFYFLLIFSFILLLIAIIFLASILKGIIWAKTTNTKITFRLISRFLGLNLIWMGFWLALVILISLFAKPASAPTFMIASIILGLYLTNTLYTIFIEREKLNSIIEAIKINATKVHWFILPYSAIFIIFFIIIKLSGLIKFDYSPIIMGLVLLTYSSVVRYYASTLVMEIENLR